MAFAGRHGQFVVDRAKVKSAMNMINESRRKREAAKEKAEAQKIETVVKAEADADAQSTGARRVVAFARSSGVGARVLDGSNSVWHLKALSVGRIVFKAVIVPNGPLRRSLLLPVSTGVFWEARSCREVPAREGRRRPAAGDHRRDAVLRERVQGRGGSERRGAR